VDAIGHLLETAFWLPCLRHPCIRGDQSLVGLKEAALSHCVDTERQALCEADSVCSGVCSALRRKPDTLRRGSCFSVRGPSLPPNSAQRGDAWGHSPRSLRLLDLRGCKARAVAFAAARCQGLHYPRPPFLAVASTGTAQTALIHLHVLSELRCWLSPPEAETAIDVEPRTSSALQCYLFRV